ncbi:unnamed protein product [Somion occarium]|uniref:NADH dehydrogenase [ubiquinone] 1 beta subcomplex subunit 4 n=1 Tax=Somion occarium TaxID=3059160 RepID=A0ABP1DAI7_9APHY
MADYIKKDPAIERWVEMKENVYKHFRFTPRTTVIAILGILVWPGAVFYLSKHQGEKWSWRGKRKESLTQFYRYLTSTADNCTQQCMCWCTLRVILYGNIKMLKLIIPELLDDLLEKGNARM